MIRPVFLGAREALGDKPLALSPALRHAWNVTYLDMISDAEDLNRLAAVTDPGSITTA